MINKNLINKLSCISCYHSDFNIAKNDTKINCRNCGREFNILDGIIDFLETTEELDREIKGNLIIAKRDRCSADDAWLLGLPKTFSTLEPRLAKLAYHNSLADFQFATRNLGVKEGDWVMDVGAGCCWTSWRLAKLGLNVIATDISFEKYVGLKSADVYMSHYGVYFDRFLLNMSSNWPFRTESIDAVLCYCSLHHAPDPLMTFIEIARVLKKNGIFCFVEASKAIFKDSGEEEFGKEEKDIYNLNECLYTLKDYSYFARKAGLKFKAVIAPSAIEKMNRLSEGRTMPSLTAKKHQIARHLRRLWHLAPIRTIILKSAINSWIARIFGTQIVAVCKK